EPRLDLPQVPQHVVAHLGLSPKTRLAPPLPPPRKRDRLSLGQTFHSVIPPFSPYPHPTTSSSLTVNHTPNPRRRLTTLPHATPVGSKTLAGGRRPPGRTATTPPTPEGSQSSLA